MKTEKSNLIFPDTSVLIGDPYSITKLSNGGNLLVIALIVLAELDNLKNDDVRGYAARHVIKQIESMSLNGQLVIENEMHWDGINLSRNKSDHQIIATFKYVINNKEKYGDFLKCKLVSEDIYMRVTARSLFKEQSDVLIEAYHANAIEMKKQNFDLPIFSSENTDLQFNYSEEVFGEILENGGVLIDMKTNNGMDSKTEGKVLTIRKGESLDYISPDLQLMGLSPYYKGQMNWNQLLAFHQLTDKGIQCVFLQGQAGTGKTLLAIAAALEQRSKFEELILVNPMVPLSNQRKIGFLPGDLKNKVSHWLLPFVQNLRYLEKNQAASMGSILESKNVKEPNPKNTVEGKKVKVPRSKKVQNKAEDDAPKEIWEKYGFSFAALDYIRGQTIRNAFIIVEEAQNLTQHDIKTIITRAGEGTKYVFCGDLSQIDIPYLTEDKSGLTYAIQRISGTGYENKMVGVCNFNIAVRSKLSAFASEVM